jgi:hypothetical protein
MRKGTEIPMLTKIMQDERDRMRRDTALLSGIIATSMFHRNPLPAEDSASRQQTPWAVEVKSTDQKSGVAAA